jgi:hypothetical protein
MANTYTLISSNTLGSAAASVTFSSIPATYTDLVVRFSVRSNRASTFDNIETRLNSDSGTNYSNILLAGDGAAASSSLSSNGTIWGTQITNGDTSTSNTFSNSELYIPNYTSTSSKPASVFSVQEDNSTTARIRVNAYLYRGSSAISSMVFTQSNGTSWLSGSSFYLYGISKS